MARNVLNTMAIESAVLEDSTIQRHLTGPIKKLVIVPGKLVNVVL